MAFVLLVAVGLAAVVGASYGSIRSYCDAGGYDDPPNETRPIIS